MSVQRESKDEVIIKILGNFCFKKLNLDHWKTVDALNYSCYTVLQFAHLKAVHMLILMIITLNNAETEDEINFLFSTRYIVNIFFFIQIG